MPALARADLERLLQSRKLGLTLPAPGAGEPSPAGDERLVAATGLPAVDGQLGGGWPRGQVSELTGPISAGATWMACASLAAATRRGELAALVDPLDSFDPESAATAGFVWPLLLWVRGAAKGTPQKRVEGALRALTLILQAQGFGLVVLDFHGVAPGGVGQLPFTTWRRLHRLVEGRDTACLLLHRAPVGRSAGGVTLALEPASRSPRGQWVGADGRAGRLAGLAARGRVARAHWQLTTLEGFAWSSGLTDCHAERLEP